MPGDDIRTIDWRVYGRTEKLYIRPKLKEEYRKLLDDHFGGVRETCMHIGADYFSFGTNVPIFDAFFEAVRAR